MARFSIFSRLVLLAAVLLCVLIGTNVYLGRELGRNVDVLSEQGRAIDLVKTAEACGEILSADGGLQQVLRLVQGSLPEKLRETAYAVALEVAAADHLVRPEEIRFLEMLGDTLELDRMTTAAIERGIRARNMTL